MGKINIVATLTVCFALFGFSMASVSAEETRFVWQLDGGVYHMISSPVLPEDPDPHVSLADNLGAYDDTKWRFFRYDPAQGGYDELKSADWDPIKGDFDFGRGYWIISRNPIEIDIEGEPIGEPVEKQIILEHEGDGWNQIGNIFDYDFPIAGLYVARTDDPDPWNNKVQLIDPGNNLTYVTFQEFENGGYIDLPADGKTNLEAGKAYWLKVEDDVDVDVILWFVIRGPSTLSNEIPLSVEFLERVTQQEAPPNPPLGLEGSTSVSGSGSGGCFIVTAAYGDYDHPMVQLMREFRDRYLLTNSFGRAFVDLYYRYSPTLASFVAKRESIKALVRFNLTPIVGASAVLSKMNMCGFLIAVAFCFLGSLFFLRGRKGAWGECKPKFSDKMREQKRTK